MTAEDFLNQHNKISHFYDDKTKQMVIPSTQQKQAMVEFARYRCTQQLHEILNNFELTRNKDVTAEGLVVKVTVDTKSIINAYPLEQIK